MDKLSDYRKQIDDIDKKLVTLLQDRMSVVEKVGDYKRENDIYVLNRDREEEVLEKAMNNCDKYHKEIKEMFIHMMDVSKTYQREKGEYILRLSDESETYLDIPKDVAVGYQGVAGAFSCEALYSFFGDDAISKSYVEFEDVFKALEIGEIEYAILPIENSSTGGINDVTDLLLEYDFYIKAETSIKINQNLITLKGAKIEDIKEVYSHPQGIEQSSKFLQKHDFKVIPFYDTAMSAKMVSDLQDKTKAAIASKFAAKEYDGLEILESNINDEDKNTTRFIILGKGKAFVKKANKVSIVFSMEHEAGYLCNLLRFFSKYSINMVKIESRPMKKTLWEYFLYIDFEGNLYDNNVRKLLTDLAKSASFFKLLGAYEG